MVSENIKETFPVKVVVELSWTKTYYTITIPTYRMEFDTFIRLGQNMSKQEIEYGKKRDNRTYPENIESYANDVSCCHYDYKNGVCNFTATTEKDVENWLKLHKDFVTL